MPADNIKILVIDDEKDFSFFVKRNLERFSYSVLVADSGQKGLQLARSHKPNLILLDILMPGINGFEVLKMLKADKETVSIPVLMLTGNDDEESRLTATNLYSQDYLVKPIEVEELRSRIEKALSSES